MNTFNKTNDNTFTSCRTCTPDTGRHPGCHVDCPKYLADKKDKDKRNAAIRNAKKVDDAYLQFRRTVYKKAANG